MINYYVSVFVSGMKKGTFSVNNDLPCKMSQITMEDYILDPIVFAIILMS